MDRPAGGGASALPPAGEQRERFSPIPWFEQAALIRMSGGDVVDGGRTVLAEGKLYRLVEIASALSAKELRRHFISLPDRCAAPLRYEGDGLARLVGRFDRPGATNFIGR